MPVDRLAAIALERRGVTNHPGDGGIGQQDLAERYGVDAERLASVLAG